MSPAHIKEFEMSDTILLHGNHPTLEYKPMGVSTANVHLGQTKLCVADEMAIALGLAHICSKTGDSNLHEMKRRSSRVAVVVAGGAPGDHFCSIAKTFPFVDLHLYDDRAWNHDLSIRASTQSVTLHHELFLLPTAKQWASQAEYDHVIFLSDLRTGNGYEKYVETDMCLQLQLTRILNADYSVLKFRLPYQSTTRQYEYLDGILELQAFPPRNSTETRLHVTDTTRIRNYDPILYANELFYHNQITRNRSKCLFATSEGSAPESYDESYYRFTRKFVSDSLDISVADYVTRSNHTRLFGIGVDLDAYKIHCNTLNDVERTLMTDVKGGDDGWTFNHYKSTPKEFKLYPTEVVRWFEQTYNAYFFAITGRNFDLNFTPESQPYFTDLECRRHLDMILQNIFHRRPIIWDLMCGVGGDAIGALLHLFPEELVLVDLQRPVEQKCLHHNVGQVKAAFPGFYAAPDAPRIDIHNKSAAQFIKEYFRTHNPTRDNPARIDMVYVDPPWGRKRVDHEIKELWQEAEYNAQSTEMLDQAEKDGEEASTLREIEVDLPTIMQYINSIAALLKAKNIIPRIICFKNRFQVTPERFETITAQKAPVLHQDYSVLYSVMAIPNRTLSEDEQQKKGIVQGRFFWVIMQHKEYMNIPDFKHEWYTEIKEKGRHVFYVDPESQFKPYKPQYAMRMSYPVIVNQIEYQNLKPEVQRKFKQLPPYPKPPPKRNQSYAPKPWAGNPKPPEKRQNPNAPKSWRKPGRTSREPLLELLEQLQLDTYK